MAKLGNALVTKQKVEKTFHEPKYQPDRTEKRGVVFEKLINKKQTRKPDRKWEECER